MTPFIKTDRLVLSPLSQTDIRGSYASWINSQEADVWTQHAIFPKNELALADYYKNQSFSNQSVWLGIFTKEEELHIGNIDISSINWINRTGIYNILIGDISQHGKGYGYEASIAMLRHAFYRMNLNRIQLGVENNNKAAIALYKKVGFVEEGILRKNIYKNGEFSDSLIMGILREEFVQLHS